MISNVFSLIVKSLQPGACFCKVIAVLVPKFLPNKLPEACLECAGPSLDTRIARNVFYLSRQASCGRDNIYSVI